MKIIFLLSAAFAFSGCMHQANLMENCKIRAQAAIIGLMVFDVIAALNAIYMALPTHCMLTGTIVLAFAGTWLFLRPECGHDRKEFKHEVQHAKR